MGLRYLTVIVIAAGCGPKPAPASAPPAPPPVGKEVHGVLVPYAPLFEVGRTWTYHVEIEHEETGHQETEETCTVMETGSFEGGVWTDLECTGYLDVFEGHWAAYPDGLFHSDEHPTTLAAYDPGLIGDPIPWSSLTGAEWCDGDDDEEEEFDEPPAICFGPEGIVGGSYGSSDSHTPPTEYRLVRTGQVSVPGSSE